jgi:hypothetical protein
MTKLLVAAAAALAAGGLAYWILSAAPKGGPGSSVSLSTETSAPAPRAAPVPAATATAAGLATAVATETSASSPAAPAALPLTPEEFSRRAESVLASLPTLDQLHALSAEELHRTPRAVLDAGAAIGDLAEAVAKNPSLAPEALGFYGKCARRENASTSVRAACLSDLRELSRRQGTPADETGIPSSVTKLADKLGSAK